VAVAVFKLKILISIPVLKCTDEDVFSGLKKFIPNA
jgi:hypothetical protein